MQNFIAGSCREVSLLLGRSLGILYSMHVDIDGIACATFCLPTTDACRGKLTMQHTPLSCKHPKDKLSALEVSIIL